MNIISNSKNDSNNRLIYQFRVAGHLGSEWADWFNGFSIIPDDNGDSILCGPIEDQAALYATIKKIRDIGLPLVSVHSCNDSRLDPHQEKRAGQNEEEEPVNNC